jgi:MoaA/NifB/PqqE/SkfB family radical SAM enzyme
MEADLAGDASHRIYLFAAVTAERDGVTAALLGDTCIRHTLVRPDPAQEPWWTEAEGERVVYGRIPELNQSRLRRFLDHAGRQRPLLLHIERVNICNLKCIICPYDQMSRAKETMDMALFRKVIADYVDMGGGDVALTPSVGEVFLDKRLVERIHHLKSPAIRDLGFVTNAGNASVFSDAELATIVNACRRINISIYGLDEEETAAMTRRAGRYERILAQAKRMIAANRGGTTIVFAFRLLKERAQDRAEAWMLEHFGRILPHGVLTAFGNWAGAIDTGVPLPFASQWADHSVGGHGDGPCAYPVMNAKVAVNGDMKFCSCIDYDSNVENIMGNVRHSSLGDIYNGPAARSCGAEG